MANPLKLTAPSALSTAIGIIASKVRDHRDQWNEALKKHERDPKKPRPADTAYPTAGSPYWNRYIAKLARKDNDGLESWYRNADVVEVCGDLAGDLIEQLRTLPEFEALDIDDIEIRWSLSAMVRKDGPLEEVTIGRAKAIPLADRLTWPDPENAPMFRLDLSLPTFLLVEEDELEAPMHALLCQLAVNGDGAPYLRKPDIAGFSANLGRYGVRTPREVQAVAHAMAHPELRAKLVRHHYDPESGQGMLWTPRVVAGEMGWN